MSGARGFADRMPAKTPANRKQPSQAPAAGPAAKAGPQMGAMTQLAAALNGAPAVRRLEETARTLSRNEPSQAGLPAQLKNGIEALSGLSMDHVRVHYNSARPAAIQAHAFARGTDIHLGPGQERHLPHEAWHVVQQAQGRVRPTTQAAADGATTIPVNDDPALESEADRMGARALSQGSMSEPAQRGSTSAGSFRGPTTVYGEAAQLVPRKLRGKRKSKRSKSFNKSAFPKFNVHSRPSDAGHPNRVDRSTAAYLNLIKFQNTAIKKIKNLYIDSSNDPELAYTSKSGHAVNEITVDTKTIYPRDTTLVRTFSAYFLGDFYKYNVTLLQETIRPIKRNKKENINKIKEAMKDPYEITSIILRGEGTAMGRPVGGDQLWGINNSYNMNIGHIKSNNFNYLKDWGLKVGNFPQIDFHGGQNTPAGMKKIPPPASQPFTFYIKSNTPLNGQTVRNAPNVISPSTFLNYKQNTAFNGFKYFEQSRISSPPKTDRQTGHRDPGKTMDSQAWKLMLGGFGGTAKNLASHEWCHLIGDGDGGQCAPQNLVIGTNSVNTEQLAMETALRSWRPALARVGYAIQIKAMALAKKNNVDGKKNQAVHIQYELSLVDPKNNAVPPIEVIKHNMDGQRGAIPKLEYEMLHAIVNQKIEKIAKARRWIP